LSCARALIFSLFFWLVFLPFLSLSVSPAWSRSALVFSPGRERIFAIDKELMLELLDLARFNTRFQQEVNRHQPWRLYLYPAMQETGTSLSLSNTLIDLKERARGLTNLKNISTDAQKSGLRLAITGSAINGTSSALELAQNAWVMYPA